MTLTQAVTWPQGDHACEESGLSQSPQHSPPHWRHWAQIHHSQQATLPTLPQSCLWANPGCSCPAARPPNQPGLSTALFPSRLGLLDKRANGVPAVATNSKHSPAPSIGSHIPATDFLGHDQFLMISWVQVQGLAKETILGSLPKGPPLTPSKRPRVPHFICTSQG